MAFVYNNNIGYKFRRLVMDTHSLIPTKKGTVNSIYFDNGGTTPPFKSVIREIKKYTPWYKYVSDKSLKAKFLSELYEESRKSIKQFVNADMEKDTVIYTKNTTEAINILSNAICLQNKGVKPVVLTTYMEHLSNYLPWKYRCNSELVEVTSDGKLSLDDLERKLKKYEGKIKLVTVVGASNVTGYINPIYEIAKLTHKYNAKIFVDAAQLIQHHPIDMTPENEMEHIDYLAFSAHKIYAPFFTGVLIGSKELLNNSYPLCFGAGMTQLVTPDKIILEDSPQRYEAGSNNLLGAIALATAIQTINQIGIEKINEYETNLLHYAINKLKENANVIIYGDTSNIENRVPIIAFNYKNKSHEEVAKYLYDSYGIIVKNGLCGADLYVEKLLQGSSYTGVIRISMALYNQTYEIDRVIKALNSLS